MPVWSLKKKADQLRVYSGSKYRLVSEAPAGTVCAVLGPTKTYPGQGLGVQPDARQPMLEPVLNYRVELPEGADPHYALLALRTLEDEDPTAACGVERRSGRDPPAADG